MARLLFPLTQAPEAPKTPPITSGYSSWSSSRADYTLFGMVGYYQSGDYINASIALTISFYTGDEEQCTISIPTGKVETGLKFLTEQARGAHWETLDAIERDYNDLKEHARAWFLEKFNYKLP
jgi:hypothetical protein